MWNFWTEEEKMVDCAFIFACSDGQNGGCNFAATYKLMNEGEKNVAFMVYWRRYKRQLSCKPSPYINEVIDELNFHFTCTKTFPLPLEASPLSHFVSMSSKATG